MQRVKKKETNAKNAKNTKHAKKAMIAQKRKLTTNSKIAKN